jgi:uncharacterized membrane protein YjfL (UPF0719 family)
MNIKNHAFVVGLFVLSVLGVLNMPPSFYMLSDFIMGVPSTIVGFYTAVWLDKFLIPQYDTFEEIRKGNIAAAILFSSMVLACALVVMAMHISMVSATQLLMNTLQNQGITPTL